MFGLTEIYSELMEYIWDQSTLLIIRYIVLLQASGHKTDQFNRQIKPELLRGLSTPSPLNLDARPVDWIQNLREYVAGANDLEQPLTGYDSHDTFVSSSHHFGPRSWLNESAVCQEYCDPRKCAVDKGCYDQFL